MNMKNLVTCIMAAASLLAVGAKAQQITTPAGAPLQVGNNGLRFMNLNAGSPQAAANGVALSVDATGNVILVPAGAGGGGTSGGWTANGPHLYNTNGGNVGIGTGNPAYRLDVAGDVNISAGSAYRIGTYPVLQTLASNVFIGYPAGNSSMSGSVNLIVGSNSGQALTTGYYNTFLGAYTGSSLTTGANNTFIGILAGQSTTTGNSNTFIGPGSGNLNASGSSNAFIGFNSGNQNTAGSNNLLMGTNAGFNNSTGSNSTFLGSNAGSNNTTGEQNTIIGSNANVGANNLSNATAIGAGAVVNVSNSVVLGSNANVGIGTSSPTARLEVVSTAAGQSGLKLSNLTSASPGTLMATNRFLTVDAAGNVVMGSASGSRELAAAASLWQAEGAALRNANAGSVVIGAGISKLPGDYKLYVEKGILTERVKVALSTTRDWADHVFEPSYQKLTLEEVDAYIRQHRHLPGVPSARQMVQEGNDLARTDALLLQKVEELTLYLIELKKQNEALRQEVEQLRQQR